MIYGHKKQQDFFRTAIAARQLSHAYIFSGTEGIGKKRFAIELARGLLCLERRSFMDCNCPSCKQVAEKSHPDYYLFDTKDDLKIDNIRKVAGISDMTTYSGGWKIIIFDDAHLLCQIGAESANALLKTLEEPGEHTLFILVTHRLDRILPTIQSRCQIIHFDPLDDKSMKLALQANDLPEDMLPYAGGSVSQAALMTEIDYVKLSAALSNNNMAEIAHIVLGAGDKNRLAAVARLLQRHYINVFKKTANPDIMVFVQYLEQAVRNLDYNLNPSIAMADLYIKLAEAGK